MMNGLYQKYLDNLAEGHELVKKNLFATAETKDSLLHQIRENSRRTYELRLENDRLLEELVHSRKAEDFTNEDVESLSEFADNLYAFLQQNDIGTSYRIHQMLYQYAELKDDFDLRIRQLYNLGTNLYYLNLQMPELGLNLYGRDVTAYLRQAADHLSQFNGIESDETRGYILRCLSNIWLADEKTSCSHQPCIPFDTINTYAAFKQYFNEMMTLYNSPEYRAMLPNFPWDRAIYNLHYNRCQYCQKLQKHHPREIMEDVYESAKYVYEHYSQFSQQNTPVQDGEVVYFYTAIKCKLGLITLPEMVDTLIALVDTADPNDFSVTGITLNLQIPLYLEYAYHAMTDEQRKPYREKLHAISEATNNYLLRTPHNEFSNVVTRAVGESIRFRMYHNKSLQRQLFNALLFCHPPTYIHVHMAATLSRKLMVHMAKTVPEKLIGLYDMRDASEIRSKAEELGERIYLCALYHDVGKLMLLDYISIYGRKLLDEEFNAIKLHPQIGASLMEHLDPPELSAVSLHHHRFYNGQGGYPFNCPPCPSQFKALVDIVTVCDSIEAATDDIGRCYSIAKTFPQIIEELRRESGTRYSPDVIALFDDEEFFKSVEEDLLRERQDIYFEVYGNGNAATHF